MTIKGVEARLQIVHDQLRLIPLESEFRNEYMDALKIAITAMDALYLLAGDYCISTSNVLTTDEQVEGKVNYYLQKASESQQEERKKNESLQM